MKHILLNKKFRYFLGLPLFLIIFMVGCGGSSSDDVVEEELSNLTLEATIVGVDASNPYGDGTGVVIFDFSANNANTYKLNFGDGEVAETSSNTITHTYIGSGTTTYTVYISAYNGTKFISTSKTITVKISSSLVWADEFNTSGTPNSSYWTYDLGAGGWGNNELQTYTKESTNVVVEGGVLKIIAKADGAGGYTSARLKSQGLKSFKYGRVDVRAKLPASLGTWPAIWMLGDSFTTVGWPYCGEIDIMEQTGTDKSKTLGTLHWYNTAGSNNASYGTSTTVTNSTSEFHVYSLEWDESSLKILVDDVQFFVMNNSSSLPFNDKFFMILNIAMGGSLGGTVPTNFTEATMEIDYVRVYQ